MRKMLVAIALAAMVGVGSYFGFARWVEDAAARDVGFVLDAWRATVGSATRGRVEFDPWTRTLKISDVVLESRTAPNTKIRLGQLVASGIDPSGKASRIEILDLETSDTLPGQLGFVMQQKAPRVTITGFSSRPLTLRQPSSAYDVKVLWLEQFSTVTAATIEIPTVTVKVSPVGDAKSPFAFTSEYTYRNIMLRDVRDGRFAELTVDSTNSRVTGSGGPLDTFSSDVGRTTVLDGDIGPLLAILDPSRTKAPGYQRLYRRMSMGPYRVRMEGGIALTVDGIVDENFGVRPDKLSIGDILFMTELFASAPKAPTPAQIGMLFEKIANIYEGFQTTKMEMRGFRVEGPETFRIGAIRVANVADGKFGEIAIEGLDVNPRYGQPFKMGRAAIKGLDIAGIVRKLAADLSGPASLGPPLGPEQLADKIAEYLSLLEGFEIKDVAVPDPKTGGLIQLHNFDVSWGKFVGGIPSQSRATLKLSGPVNPRDPEPFMQILSGAGINVLSISADVGSIWTETTKTLTVEPATFNIDRVLGLSLRGSLRNVSRDLFSKDIAKSMAAAFLVEPGPVELSLRDQGFVDLVAAQAERGRGRPGQPGRAILLAEMNRDRPKLVQLYPGLEPLFRALEQFLQGKGETLTVKVTPKGRVGLMQLVEEATTTDPGTAFFKNFSVEARTGR